MHVSVVVPARNAEHTIGACVEAALRQSHPPREVVVVDDGSTDGTREAAETAGALVVCQRGRGPAAARNHGASESGGEVIAFTDADCLPHGDWIERLCSGFSEGVGAVGGTYGIANASSRLARMVHAEIRERHARQGDAVDFLGTYNMAVRREAFEGLGGFDENFTAAACEDNDFSYRLGAAGWKLRYMPAAVVDHHHPERLGAYLKAQARHGYWRVQLYRKHRGRIGGDRYAGPLDLVAPGWALLNVLLLAGLPGGWMAGGRIFAAQAAISAPLLLGYTLWRAAQSVRLWRATGDRWMLEYGDLAFLRDLARAWGLFVGIVHPPGAVKEIGS